MIGREDIENVVQHHLFIPGLALCSFVMFLLVLMMFVTGSRSPQSTENQEEGGKMTSSKKKKTKKQRSNQDKKSAVSPKVKKETTKNAVDSLMETTARATEVKQEKKREGKSKTKSKKKKNTQLKTETEMVPEVGYEEAAMDGEWQTVTTKEQREQLKREKKKQEETVALETEKSDSLPLGQPQIKVSAGIPAIAKGIAPRFAKAAGEPWQGKESAIGGSHMPSKRPMPPVTIPGMPKQQTKSSPTEQPWISKSPILSTPWAGQDNAILPIVPSTDKNTVPSWTQNTSNWPQQGNIQRMVTEDWVKIADDGQNGRSIPVNNEGWVNGSSPAQPQARENGVESKGDQWMLEPEGLPVEPPLLDPSDPWNFEFVETSEDWAAPVSTWDNTTDEWTAPVPVKSEPTYYDESSDDNKATLKAIVSQQSAAPGQSKKSKRRRKKKQAAASEPEQVTSISSNSEEIKKPQETTLNSGNVLIKTEEAKVPEQSIETQPAEESNLLNAPEQPAKEDWTMTKTAKKRKPKARKAD